MLLSGKIHRALQLLNKLEQDYTNLNARDTDIYGRIDNLTAILDRTGIFHERSRLDYRLTRLEILEYYHNEQRRAELDAEALRILEDLECRTSGRNFGRQFPEDEHYILQQGEAEMLPVNFTIQQDGRMWYADFEGKRIYLSEDPGEAQRYFEGLVREVESEGNPHRYLAPEEDGIDIPDNCILADVGAAEGYFGIRHIEKCKKVYFFECDERWLKYLRKTCEPFGGRVEIVEGYAGEGGNNIRLDEFFKDREKPTCVKMDVEGAEGAVLRGMAGLFDTSDPLTLLICTYHRQEDFSRYSEMLKDRFDLSASKGYFWHMPDAYPPYFRRGILRAVKKESKSLSSLRE